MPIPIRKKRPRIVRMPLKRALRGIGAMLECFAGVAVRDTESPLDLPFFGADNEADRTALLACLKEDDERRRSVAPETTKRWQSETVAAVTKLGLSLERISAAYALADYLDQETRDSHDKRVWSMHESEAKKRLVRVQRRAQRAGVTVILGGGLPIETRTAAARDLWQWICIGAVWRAHNELEWLRSMKGGQTARGNRQLPFRQRVRFALWKHGRGLSQDQIALVETALLVPVSLDRLPDEIVIADSSPFPKRPAIDDPDLDLNACFERVVDAVNNVTRERQPGYRRQPGQKWIMERTAEVEALLAGCEVRTRYDQPVHIGFRDLEPCADPPREHYRGHSDEVTCPACLRKLIAAGWDPCRRGRPAL